MEEGKKSLAFSMTYFDAERTLTDEEVTEAHNRVLTTVEEKFGAELRSNKKLPDLFRQFLLDWLSENVGKSIYYKNRRYIWSYGRYIIKIADIFGVTVDILQNRRYIFRHLASFSRM